MRKAIIPALGIIVLIAAVALLYNLLKDKSPTLDKLQTAEYHSITPKEVKSMMDGDETFTIVDVRTQSEYDSGHISGAILIPDTEIADRAETDLPDKSAFIIVYCQSGVRSRGAANALVGLGYTSVYDLGGIINWPYETVK